MNLDKIVKTLALKLGFVTGLLSVGGCPESIPSPSPSAATMVSRTAQEIRYNNGLKCEGDCSVEISDKDYWWGERVAVDISNVAASKSEGAPRFYLHRENINFTTSRYTLLPPLDLSLKQILEATVLVESRDFIGGLLGNSSTKRLAVRFSPLETPPPPPPPPPPAVEEEKVQPVISVRLNSSRLVYPDGDKLTAIINTELVHSRDGRTISTEPYAPSRCSLSSQVVSWKGEGRGPLQRFQSRQRYKRYEIPIAFNEQVQISNSQHTWTPYRFLISCDDLNKRHFFLPYELGILVEKATEILPPENRLPLCAVEEGKHEYKEWNDGNSDDGLGLKTLEKVNPQNRPPDRFLSKSTVIIDEGDSISLKLPQLCSDPDNDPLRYFVRLSSGSPQHLKYSHSTSGQNLILTINPREKHDYTKAAEEPETFEITVQDYQIIENGEVPEERVLHAEKPVMSLKIKINPVNDLPEEHDDALFQKRPIFSPTILYPFGYFCREFFDDQDNYDNDDSSNDQLSCQEKIVCAGTELAAEKYQVEVAKNGQRRLTIYAGECEGVVTLDENLNKPSFTPKASLIITASDGHSQTSIKRPFFLYSPFSLHGDNFKGNLVIWGDSVAGRANGCQDYLYIKPSASLLQGLSSLFQDGLTTTTYQLEFKTDGNNFTFVKGYNPETIINDILGGLRASVPTGQRVKQYQACLTLVAVKEKK